MNSRAAELFPEIMNGPPGTALAEQSGANGQLVQATVVLRKSLSSLLTGVDEATWNLAGTNALLDPGFRLIELDGTQRAFLERATLERGATTLNPYRFNRPSLVDAAHARFDRTVARILTPEQMLEAQNASAVSAEELAALELFEQSVLADLNVQSEDVGQLRKAGRLR